MSYTRVIWDFNGTILDDLSVSIESANELLKRYSLPIIPSVDAYHSVFGFPIIEYYKRIGFDFSIYDFSVLANEWVAIYLDKVKEAPLRSEVKDTLIAIKDMGIKQTVLSMSEQSMLTSQLKALGVIDYFDEICGLTDIYANSKLALASKWKEGHLEESVIYIGDTLHDAESAKIIGAKCLLLSGGHDSVNSLKSSGLDVIESPHQLISYLNN